MNIIGNAATGSLPYIFCIYLLQITLMSFRWNALLDFMYFSPGVFACFKNIWAGVSKPYQAQLVVIFSVPSMKIYTFPGN